MNYATSAVLVFMGTPIVRLVTAALSVPNRKFAELQENVPVWGILVEERASFAAPATTNIQSANVSKQNCNTINETHKNSSLQL